MKKLLFLGTLLFLASPRMVSAQFGGGASAGSAGGFAGAARESGSSPAENERSKRLSGNNYGDPTSTFIEASILMNVKADEYVAVFGVTQQGVTPEEANSKMDATIAAFKTGIKALGINDEDVFVDFVVQNRIYGFKFEKATDVQGATTREELTGFALKKNVSIHFKDKTLVDQLGLVAARSEIYDLIKVDYLVKDREAIKAQLQAQTFAIIKRKADLYQNALGLKLPPLTQIVLDKPSVYYPIEQYNSYKASEESSITMSNRDYVVQNALKTSTVYFNPLSGADFDTVINPTIIEPVVQFTTYIKVRYSSPQKRQKATGFGGL